MTSDYVYHTNIWLEEPEDDNPFAAKACYCHGYDVFRDILGKSTWPEYLLLLFLGKRPTKLQCSLFEKLGIALANPGPREASVRAAMNAGVAGTPPSSALIAAIGVGSGQYGGAQEVAIAVDLWGECGKDLTNWAQQLHRSDDEGIADIWGPMEHPPGFDPNADFAPTPVTETLSHLAKQAGKGSYLSWLEENRQSLEQVTGNSLAMSGVAAAAFADLGMNADQAAMLYLIVRLPGAAVHALEQGEMGWKKFPFYGPAVELS